LHVVHAACRPEELNSNVSTFHSPSLQFTQYSIFSLLAIDFLFNMRVAVITSALALASSAAAAVTAQQMVSNIDAITQKVRSINFKVS
jgi:hypothetical protein